MTQCIAMAAQAPSPTIEIDPLAVDDPSMVSTLMAEVDAILREAIAAEAPARRRPAPPAVGCAQHGPRRAGRFCHPGPPPTHVQVVRRTDPTQRSPPAVRRAANQMTARPNGSEVMASPP